jgi:cyclohexyl-isocyanide hydratase
LQVAALLCGEQKAQEIQFGIQYAPDPPFNSGTPESAPPEVFEAVRSAFQQLADARFLTAQRIRARLDLEELK